jgi:hypothetical protein
MTGVKEGGTSIATVLGLLFIVLKLTHLIDWSWWWVLAPFWIPIAIALVVIGVVVVVAGFKGWK